MKVHFISLGCPKNLVDSEKILGALTASGIDICLELQESDIIIINTCGFIQPALDETEQEIRRITKNVNKNQKVLVYGCSVNRFRDYLQQNHPRVSQWYTLEQKQEMVHEIETKAKLTDVRLPTTIGYAYLKIAEGCSNRCSYCTIPLIKGPFRSRKIEEIVEEAAALADYGFKEIILIAQDTGNYGVDLYNKPMLVPLIQQISKLSGIEWIRIMYLHPKSITDEIIHEIKDNEIVCKYLDIPIQHVNDIVLQNMNRGVNRKQIENHIDQLKNIKGISLRTTVMVGFPGETENQFNELFAFLKERKFDWLGVFPFYQEAGTSAERLTPIPLIVVEDRYNRMLMLQHDIIEDHNKSMIGKTYKTLIHRQSGTFVGHIEQTCPEIDSHIIVQESDLKPGNFYSVAITGQQNSDLCGKIPAKAHKDKEECIAS